jgi:hypothetical protein
LGNNIALLYRQFVYPWHFQVWEFQLRHAAAGDANGQYRQKDVFHAHDVKGSLGLAPSVIVRI